MSLCSNKTRFGLCVDHSLSRTWREMWPGGKNLPVFLSEMSPSPTSGLMHASHAKALEEVELIKKQMPGVQHLMSLGLKARSLLHSSQIFKYGDVVEHVLHASLCQMRKQAQRGWMVCQRSHSKFTVKSGDSSRLWPESQESFLLCYSPLYALWNKHLLYFSKPMARAPGKSEKRAFKLFLQGKSFFQKIFTESRH